jgi:hypothetical protein
MHSMSVPFSAGLGLNVGYGLKSQNGIVIEQPAAMSLYSQYSQVPSAVAKRQSMQKLETYRLPLAPASAASASLVGVDVTALSAQQFVKETFAAQEAAGGPSSRRERCSAKQWRTWNDDLRILGL